MSRERYLLESALSCIPWHHEFLRNEIRDFLSTTEPTQDDEPVGILRHNGQFELQRMVGIPLSQPMKLYEHPAPREFVRLSEEEVERLMDSALSPNEITEHELYYFARAIEDALEEKNK